jgi:PAS domain S-box-containing protein
MTAKKGLTSKHMEEKQRVEKTKDLVHANALLSTINKVQSMVITHENSERIFESLLSALLDLTRSEYGFIAELLHDNKNLPYMKSRAITNIAWNQKYKTYYDKDAEKGLLFNNLNTLYGAVVTTGKPVISNHPSKDRRSGGIPEGHPPLNSFLGLPIFNHDKLIGVVGIANRPGGYSEKTCDYLAPFLITCAHMIDAYRMNKKREQAEAQLRMSENRNKQILESTNQGFWRINNEHRITQINSAMCTILDVSLAEAVGGQVEKFVAGDNIDMFRREMALRDKGVGSTYHIVLKKRNGTRIFCQVSASPLFDRNGNKSGSFCMITDITELKKREKKLTALNRKIQSLNQTLEQQVKIRTIDLENTLEAATKANRSKSVFLANMSHELRTPLNAIIGFSQVLENQYFGTLNEKQKDYVKDILDSGQHLLSLINEILDLSKIEAGQKRLEPDFININNLVEDSLTMIREKALKREIDLVFKGDEKLAERKIYADEKKLKQVLYNLNSNAVKFTPGGGKINLFTSYISNDVSLNRSFKDVPGLFPAALICIEDTGAGIPLELKEKIFENFYQVKKGYSDKTPGTGLGLPLSKQYVELHNGRIWVESEGGGKGSRFYVLLPDADPQNVVTG